MLQHTGLLLDTRIPATARFSVPRAFGIAHYLGTDRVLVRQGSRESDS
jgi:hypothetical protein